MKKLKLEKFIKESVTISLISNGVRLQKELNQDLKKFDLNLHQALILLAIFFEPDKCIRSYDLLTILPTTKGNISHCTSYLEECKLINRKIVSGDLRGFEFHLTNKALKLCPSLVKFFDQIESKTDSKLSNAETKMFIKLAKEI